MRIGIIDADLLGRQKHRFPNLACEKISGYWKTQGADVTLILDREYSWLLYPDMINILPENSNIKAFAKNFEIIGKIQDSEQAFENLFGKTYKRPPKLKNPTKLQKLAAATPKSFGFACGIIYL